MWWYDLWYTRVKLIKNIWPIYPCLTSYIEGKSLSGEHNVIGIDEYLGGGCHIVFSLDVVASFVTQQWSMYLRMRVFSELTISYIWQYTVLLYCAAWYACVYVCPRWWKVPYVGVFLLAYIMRPPSFFVHRFTYSPTFIPPWRSSPIRCTHLYLYGSHCGFHLIVWFLVF